MWKRPSDCEYVDAVNGRARRLTERRILCILAGVMLASASFAATKPATKPTTTKPAPTQQAAPKATTTQPEIQQVVRARVIELTDGKGTIRASMGASEDGPVVFRLFNKDGKMAVTVDSDGGITILNADGKPKITVGKQGDSYGIAMYNSKGESRAGLTMDGDEPMLSMQDSAGKYRAMLFIQKDEPYISLSDGKSDSAHVMMYVRESAPGVAMWDTSGKLRSSYVLLADSTPRLMMMNSNADPCLKLTVADGLPSVEILNPKNDIGGIFGFINDADLTMMFTDADNKARAIMSLSSENGPYISVAHPSGNPATTMAISESGSPYFRTADSDNNTLWRSP